MITHRVSTAGFGVQEYSQEEKRAAIFAAEGLILQAREAQITIEPEHLFVPGLYARKIVLPAGSWNTGKLHAQDDLLIIAKGRVTFYTEHGSRTLEGPCMTTVPANTKPLVFAHEETWMFSAHPNPDNSTDLEKIEGRVVIPNELGCMPKEVLS